MKMKHTVYRLEEQATGDRNEMTGDYEVDGSILREEDAYDTHAEALDLVEHLTKNEARNSFTILITYSR